MKGKHFVVFAYGSEFSHMVNAPEVVIVTGENYLTVYTSYRSYVPACVDVCLLVHVLLDAVDVQGVT